MSIVPEGIVVVEGRDRRVALGALGMDTGLFLGKISCGSGYRFRISVKFLPLKLKQQPELIDLERPFLCTPNQSRRRASLR